MGSRENKLPQGWIEASLGELASRIVGGGTPSKSKGAYFKGDIPFMTVKDMRAERPVDTQDHITKEALENSSSNLIEPDTLIIVTRIGLGKAVRASFATAINQDLKAIYFEDEHIEKDFIEKWYRYNEKTIQQMGKGTTVKGIRLDALKALRVPFPPLNEQKRIVAKIEELQTRSRRAREALDTVPDLLEQLRQSTLSAAFRGDLTRKWREQNPEAEPASKLLERIRTERRKRWEDAELDKLKAKGLTGDKLDAQFAKRRKQYKKPVPVDTSDLPELPTGWEWASVSEVSTSNLGKMLDKNKHTSGSLLPYLRNVNVRWGSVDTDDLSKMYFKESEIERYSLSKGDVIICEGGEPGRSAVWDKSEPVLYQKALHRVRPFRGFLPWLFVFKLRYDSKAGTLEKYFTGTTIKHFTGKSLSGYPVCIPPTNEQKEIVAQIEGAFNKIEALAEKTEILRNRLLFLEDSILRKAFTGKLVPQDPNDEPASVLLERIRQEKARQAAEQKTKPRRRGKKMKGQEIKQKDILTILKEAGRAMTPEELFAASGFGEDLVDDFYEQLRSTVEAKKVRETRKGAVVRLEVSS